MRQALALYLMMYSLSCSLRAENMPLLSFSILPVSHLPTTFTFRMAPVWKSINSYY